MGDGGDRRRARSAVVVAAGRGERLAAAADGRPKALVELDGRPLVDLALTCLLAAGVDDVVVVFPPGHHGSFRAVTAGRARLVPGGATRTESMRSGTAAVTGDVVAIHDAARPLVPLGVVRRTFAAVTGDVIAAAPGVPVADTLKQVGADGEVVGTVDRQGLWAVHTPQVVRRDALEAALEWAGEHTATDDLGLLERARAAAVVAGRIVLVPGDPRDLKVTYPEDLAVATAIVRGSRP